MAQNIPLKINILNQTITIQKQDFYTLKTIIDLDNVNQLKLLNISTMLYDEYDLKIFHIFFYYIINITYGKQQQNIQLYYVQLMRPYYFEHKCYIDINKYSKICAKILSTATITIHDEYCLYMCYYLVYGRLVSSSYIKQQINNTCYGKRNNQNANIQYSCNDYNNENDNQRQMPRINSKEKCKISRNHSNPCTFFKSKKNSFCHRQKVKRKTKQSEPSNQQQLNSKNSEYQLFAAELQQIFSKDIKNQFYKYSTPSHKISAEKCQNNAHSQASHKNTEQHSEQTFYINCMNRNNKNGLKHGNSDDLKYFLNYFPNRVNNTERSAIMQSVYPGAHSVRNQVRKLRFNLDSKKYIKYRESNCAEIQNSVSGYSVQKYMKQGIVNTNNKKQKTKIKTNTNTVINDNKLKTLNQQFKVRSEELDKIRCKLKVQNQKTRQKNVHGSSQTYNINFDIGDKCGQQQYINLRKINSLSTSSGVNNPNLLDKARKPKTNSNTNNNYNMSNITINQPIDTPTKTTNIFMPLFSQQSNSQQQQHTNQQSISKKQRYEQDYQDGNNFYDISKRMKNVGVIQENEEKQNMCSSTAEATNHNLQSKQKIYHYRTQYRSFMKAHLFNFFDS